MDSEYRTDRRTVVLAERTVERVQQNIVCRANTPTLHIEDPALPMRNDDIPFVPSLLSHRTTKLCTHSDTRDLAAEGSPRSETLVT